jgi:hypothetical protein
MKKVQDFVDGFARSRKSTAEIKKTINVAYEDKAWRMISIYYVIMKVKAGQTIDNQRHLHTKENQEDCRHCCRRCCQKKKKENRRITCKDITSAHEGVH